MIEWLNIRNLALIESAEIEFKPGFTVITGETGAGKSVLMGAMSVLLGERADKRLIRSGEARCEISAGLKLGKQVMDAVGRIVEKADAEFDRAGGTVILRRVITHSGSRNYVNDTPVTLQVLEEIGNLLIDVHGPHEHQSLLKQSVQLQMLDRYAGLEKAVAACADAWQAILSLQTRIAEMEKDLPSSAEAEYLRAVLSEIDKAAPRPG